MAKIEIEVNDVSTSVDQMWKTKKEKERNVNDKYKDKQGKPIRKPK